MTTRLHDLTCQAEHQRDIRIRTDRPPFRARPVRHVVLERRGQHDLRAARRHLPEIVFKRVATEAAGLVLCRARRQGAENDEGIGVPRYRIKCVGLAAAGVVIAQRVPQDHGTGSNGIGVDMAGIAAGEIQHALEQRGGMVKPAATGPAIGAGENRRVAESFRDTAYFPCDEVRRLVPAYGDKLFPPPAMAVARFALLQPPLADQRLQYASVGLRPFAD